MPERTVVAGATRHRGQVQHRDDRLVNAEETAQQCHAGLRTSVSRVRGVLRAADQCRFGSGDHHLDAGLLDALDLLGVGADVGHDGRHLLDRHHGAHRHRPELRAVGDHDDPFGSLEATTDHIGIAVVELGDTATCRETGRADHRGIGVVAAHSLDGRRADAGQLVLADQPSGNDHPHIARPEQARNRQRWGDDHEIVANREQPGEMLDRGADAEEHRAHADGELRRALCDESLLACA